MLSLTRYVDVDMREYSKGRVRKAPTRFADQTIAGSCDRVDKRPRGA